MEQEDTICAVSTPPGSGAVAMIRVSGKEAMDMCNKVIRFPDRRKQLKRQQAGTIHYAGLFDGEQQIDEVMVSIFKAPRSYTGEDVVEITCHGSVYIQQQILLVLIQQGARPARPGEFTMRAFLNGKMDLAQAESVADLIAAESAVAHRIALNQLKGVVSDKIRQLRRQLLHFASLIELELDFGEEDVEFADREELLSLAGEIDSALKTVAGSFRQGNVMKNGIPVAIIGEPNVGKSTLLNVLLQEEKAIVSDIPGTTRDYIEDTITIEGYMFRFIDTAGLHASQDKIERLGIDRTYKKIKQASVIMLLTDIRSEPEDIHNIYGKISTGLDRDSQHIILVVNKTDTVQDNIRAGMEEKLREITEDIVFISALRETHLDELRARLTTVMRLRQPGEQEVVISNMRHYEALTRAGKAIQRTIHGLNDGLSNDLVAQDLREAIHYMGEITGEITTDEILGNIFKNFCIGK